jgi:hypothetical protein
MGKGMPDIGALFDMSAHARGGHGGYSSCHYNCGWNMLSALCAFILFGGVWAIIKGTWKDGGFIWGSLAIALGGGVAIATLLIGPVVIVGGIIAVVVAVVAWMSREKKA